MTKQVNPPSVWTVQLCRIAGIPIRIHWTFFAFLLWIGLSEFVNMGDPFSEVLFVLAVFFCIVLHELGHALTAARFKIKTRDITLYPIGGIAMLSGEARPSQEFFIAAAGPLVNVLIAFALVPLLTPMPGEPQEMEAILPLLGFWDRLCAINILLVVFNLIPAFPMDGGRILRAVLAMTFGETVGAKIAVRVGQLFSVLFIMIGLLYGNIILAIIGLFVLMNASRESAYIRGKEFLAGRKVKDVMLDAKDFTTLPHGTSLERALEISATARQEYFPIEYSGDIIGVVNRNVLLQAASEGNGAGYVSSIMDREIVRASPEDQLEERLRDLDLSALRPILVFDQGKLVGMIGLRPS